MSIISVRSHRDLREITNLAEFLVRSLLSRRKLFHIGVISFVPQKYLSSRRDLVSISPEIAFISCRSQRHYKFRRVLDEISARSRSSRRDRRDITNLAELLARSRRNLVYLAAISEAYKSRRVLDEISFISPRPQRHYQSRRVIGEISAKSRLSRRDLRDITNLAEISSGLTRSRRDLCHLGQISLISPRSRRDRVEISATIQIWPRSRRVLVNLGDSPISARSRLNFCTGTASNLPASVGSRSVYIFAFQLHHKTSKGCHVYLSTRRPSVIDRLPRKATLFWHSWTECETKTLWRPRIIWKLECLIVLRLSKTEYCDGKYR